MDISKDSDQSLVKKCFEFCSALTERGCSYSFSLKVGQSFNFTLKSGKGAPPKAKPKRSPSYFRRQIRRREDFLKKRSGSFEKNVDADSRHNQTNQNDEAAVENSCHLNLCPIPVDPRKSEGSVESESEESEGPDDSEDDDGIQQAQSEPAPHCDCGNCREDWVREKEESRSLETWKLSDENISLNCFGQRMRWSEVRSYHLRHLVIAERDCKLKTITLADMHKYNRCDSITVHNGRLRCEQKPSCNGAFSAEKYYGDWYLRCEECNPFRTKCGNFGFRGFRVPKCQCGECKDPRRLVSYLGYTKNKQ